MKSFIRTFTSKSLLSKSWKNPNKVSSTDTPAVATEYLMKILTSDCVYEVAQETPVTYAAILSSTYQNEFFLKREDTQPVFSFKIRGAYNKIASLPSAVRAKGVVACSAGNHAQGVAMSAARLGIRATIVMPLATPSIKLKAVQRFGGATVTVKLHGQNYDEAAAEANRLVTEQGLTMIHPFNDPLVIAGQGTIGKEIIKSFNGRQLDAVFACVGGGGLLAGIAAYIKSIRPDVLVIGVEADDAAGMTSSLIAGKVITLPHVGLFADGAAVRTVGDETFRVCQQLVDGMITVTTDEICAAIKQGFNDTRCVMEPAGALALAGMVKYSKMNQWNKKHCIAITSGANMDFDRLRFVSERADSSEFFLNVAIPERPNSLREFYKFIHPRSVTELCYRYNGTSFGHFFLSVQAINGVTIDADKEVLLSNLLSNGYIVEDLADNELAKLHLRYLQGGRFVPTTDNNLEVEVLFRMEFPEAPGALSKFLDAINFSNHGWNISLFHYRSHGHDIGRILVGLRILPEEKSELIGFLNNLGYYYEEETDNDAYVNFLM